MPVVMIEDAGIPGIVGRRTVDRALLRIKAGPLHIGEPGCIVTDKKIQLTVAVIVYPGGACRPVRFALFHQARLARDLFKAPMHIMQQVDSAVRGDEQIGPAIIVIIGCRHALTISHILIETGRMGHVLKSAVTAVTIEHIRGTWAGRTAGSRTSLYGKN